MTSHEKGNDTRREILAFIKSYWRSHTMAPSYDEIIQATSISSKSVVKYHLDILKSDGKITFDPNKSRTIRPVGMRVEFEDVKS